MNRRGAKERGLNHEGAKSAKEREGKKRRSFPSSCLCAFVVQSPLCVLCVLCRVPSGQMRFIPGFSRFLSSHDLKFTPKITEALRAVRGDCDGVLDFDVANFRVVELGLD